MALAERKASGSIGGKVRVQMGRDREVDQHLDSSQVAPFGRGCHRGSALVIRFVRISLRSLRRF